MRKATSNLGFVAVIALLTGCMIAPTTWSKVGVTMEQGSKDLEECASKADLVYQSSSTGGQLAVGAFLDAKDLRLRFDRCMEGKGYRKRS